MSDPRYQIEETDAYEWSLYELRHVGGPLEGYVEIANIECDDETAQAIVDGLNSKAERKAFGDWLLSLMGTMQTADRGATMFFLQDIISRIIVPVTKKWIETGDVPKVPEKT